MIAAPCPSARANKLGRRILCLVLLFPMAAFTANVPCSGSKGGVDHCQGATFVCRDGSVSASKKICETYLGGAALSGSTPVEMTPSGSQACSCRSGSFCVGPRGGHYCLTDAGAKSYLRQ